MGGAIYCRMAKIRVCLASDVPPGSMVNIDLLGRTVLFANVGGTFYAMDGICPHAIGNLARGKLEGFIVECPRHFWKFDLRDGKLVSGPPKPVGNRYDLRVYAVTVSEGWVDVDMI